MADELRKHIRVTVDGKRGIVTGVRAVAGEQGPLNEYLVDTQDGYARWYPSSAIAIISYPIAGWKPTKPEATSEPATPTVTTTDDAGAATPDESVSAEFPAEPAAETVGVPATDEPASEQSTQVETETASEPEQTDDTGRTENADTPPAVANASAATEA